MALPATVKSKKQGDIIRSEDWNIVTNEVDRLDVAKANLTGAVFTGPLTVGNQFKAQSLAFVDSNNQLFPDAWIGMAPNIDGTTKWLHIGGITDGGVRRIALFAHRTLVAGNLGIGAVAPKAPLHIAGGNWDVTNSNGDLYLGNDTHKLKIGIALGGGGAGDVRIRAQGGTNRLLLGGDSSDSLFIDPTGVTVPGSLSFGAAVRQMINLWNQDYGIGVQAASLYQRTGGHFQWFRGGSHHNDTSNPGPGGTQMMLLDSAAVLWVNGPYVRVKGAGNEQCYLGGDGAGGDVQVGSMNAGIKNIVMYNPNYGYMDLYANQGFKAGGGPWASFSDERLKKNIQTLSGSLDKLLSLRGVSFEYKDSSRRDYLPGKQTGMIAQEVEKVFPEWVGEGKEGFKTLGIMGFEALVVESLRELKSEIENIKAHLGLSVGSQSTADSGKSPARSTKKS